MNDVVAGLRAELNDAVHEPGDDEYATATSPHNSSHLQRPRFKRSGQSVSGT